MRPLFWTICLLFVLPLSISAANFMCYYPSYATYFPGTNSFPPGRIDPSLCTHLFYAFATLDQNTYQITAQDPSVDIDEQGFSSFTAIKLKNKNLKTLISLGGGSDSNDGTGKYSKLVSNTANIKAFVDSVMTFLQTYGFDGLDLDWEVPSGPADKAGFTQLAQALRTAFNPKGYLLSAALPSDINQVINGYDLPALNKSFDFINLMTYDMHTTIETTVDHLAPLYERPWDADLSDEKNNVDSAVSYYISNGVSPSKLILGIPVYGSAWTLSSSSKTPMSPASGPAQAGFLTEQAGLLGYIEICSNIVKNKWTVVQDPTGKMGPYAYSPAGSPNIQWVGYDDPAFATVKANYASAKGLGGTMVWDLTQDDFLNTCGAGVNPMLKAISKVMLGSKGK